MEMAFSRGLHTGWLRGLNHQHLVHGRFGKKRGVFLGEVARVGRSRVFMRLRGPLKPGDGVVFDAGRPDQDEEGGRVYALEQAGDTAVLAFRRGGLDLTRVRAGHKVWKTSDQELDRRLRQSYAGQLPHFQRPIHLRVQGNAGEPLRLRAQDEEGRSAEVTSAVPLAPATRHPLTTERLAGHLGRLGGTPFRLGRLENRLADDVILPLSELNRLRRETVKQLDIVRARPPAWTVKPMPPGTAAWRALLEEARNPAPASAPAATARPQLAVLVRTPDQLEAVLATAVPRIYCDFDDPKRYREAVARGRADRHTTSESSTEKSPAATRPVVQTPEVFVAPPRIAKPGEDWMLRQVRASEADGYLVRNYDHLAFFAGARCVGDYSLNIANPLAAACFLRRFSLERVTASYDLNNRQLEALLTSAPPAWFEITVHQHVPMFHMDHCLWCAFLTAATDHTNCGRPCDRVAVKLRDRTGAEHPVRADAGCRNTVFNARAHTGAEHVARLLVLGARHFRLEFLDEPPALVVQTIEAYRRLLRHAWGHISTFDNWSAAEFCGAPLPAGSKPPAPG
jgi:putative protease